MHPFTFNKIQEIFTSPIKIEKLFAGVIEKHIEGKTHNYNFTLDVSREKIISVQISMAEFELSAVIKTRGWVAVTSHGNRLPHGEGVFYCNETPIAKYRDGNIFFASNELPPIYIVEDNFTKRYLWARHNNQGIATSFAYASRRKYIIDSPNFSLASFCGDAGRTCFLNPEDLKIVAQLNIKQQISILLMCYLWNICAPHSDAFALTEQNEDVQGDRICDIPSVRANSCQLKTSFRVLDRLLCFIVEGGWLVFLALFLCYAIVLEFFALLRKGVYPSIFYLIIFSGVLVVIMLLIFQKSPFKVFSKKI